jgi:hypothetical protein
MPDLACVDCGLISYSAAGHANAVVARGATPAFITGRGTLTDGRESRGPSNAVRVSSVVDG